MARGPAARRRGYPRPRRPWPRRWRASWSMPARRNRDLPCFNYSLAAASALQRPEQARPDARRQRNIEDLDEEQVEEEAAEAGDDGGLGTESRSAVERDPQPQPADRQHVAGRSEEHTSEI